MPNWKTKNGKYEWDRGGHGLDWGGVGEKDTQDKGGVGSLEAMADFITSF